MSDNKKVYILGGGTVFHVAPHLALASPAYGETALQLQHLCLEEFPDMAVQTHLTKMAGGPHLETNEDVAIFVDEIIKRYDTKIVFFNIAMMDFSGEICDLETESGHTDYVPGKYGTRIKSSAAQGLAIALRPAEKVLTRIRQKRKDITLVAFKTTCGATEDEQYLAGLNLLKKASCNLVLANDVKTRVNMIITPEEARYHVTTNRLEALRNLVQMTNLRSHLTFTRSTVVAGEPVSWNSPEVPMALREVVNYCIQRGAYKPFRGATVGHFAAKIGENKFLTSRRKTNFNDIEKLGLVKVETDGPDSVIAYGAKPSVGGQSQRIIFTDHPKYDSIVHFHCPLKLGSKVPTVSQREYECGSHECGRNTSRGLKEFMVGSLHSIRPDQPTVLAAVYLDQHGPNIVFNSKDCDIDAITHFIEENFDLDAKTGGYVSLPGAQPEGNNA